VKDNADLREACHPEEVPKEDEVDEGKGGEGGGKKGSSGAQDGKGQISDFTVILGIVCSTILGIFRW
jgi:hypothetical protein